MIVSETCFAGNPAEAPPECWYIPNNPVALYRFPIFIPSDTLVGIFTWWYNYDSGTLPGCLIGGNRCLVVREGVGLFFWGGGGGGLLHVAVVLWWWG